MKRLKHRIGIFKIGMQLFYKEGPTIVNAIQNEGGEVFLDLKLHDIPNTVASACESLLALKIYLLTLHVSGGKAMLEAAQAVMQDNPTHLLGVTVLTSLDTQTIHETFPKMPYTANQWAIHLAELAQSAGLYGVVCSAEENEAVRQRVGSSLCLVNPGIRPSGSDVQDQKRVVTPLKAMQSGANYLVMGRPILQASDPLGLVDQIYEELGYAPGLSA